MSCKYCGLDCAAHCPHCWRSMPVAGDWCGQCPEGQPTPSGDPYVWTQPHLSVASPSDEDINEYERATGLPFTTDAWRWWLEQKARGVRVVGTGGKLYGISYPTESKPGTSVTIDWSGAKYNADTTGTQAKRNYPPEQQAIMDTMQSLISKCEAAGVVLPRGRVVRVGRTV